MDKIAFKLHERLVQCCIDFINEHKDDKQVQQIQVVELSVDCLQESAKAGELRPESDSWCNLFGTHKLSDGSLSNYLIGSTY